METVGVRVVLFAKVAAQQLTEMLTALPITLLYQLDRIIVGDLASSRSICLIHRFGAAMVVRQYLEQFDHVCYELHDRGVAEELLRQQVQRYVLCFFLAFSHHHCRVSETSCSARGDAGRVTGSLLRRWPVFACTRLRSCGIPGSLTP